jgi:hypothetical protein
MKLLSIAAIAVGAVTQIPTAAIAFTTVTYSSIARPSSSKTQLHSVEDMRQRIKTAGGGITTIVPGDLSVYDPDEGGKLQGTGDIQKRITAGASFPGNSTPVVASAPAAAPSATSGGSSEVSAKPKTGSGTVSLSNLLNSIGGRRGTYGGQSQC